MPSSRLSHFRPDQIWRQAQEPTFWLDKALRITWVNPAWESLTGHSASAVLGLSCTPHSPISASDLQDLAAGFHPPAATLLGYPSSTLSLILHSGGEQLWRVVDFWPYHDQKSDLSGILGRVRSNVMDLDSGNEQRNDRHHELLACRKSLLERHGLDSLIGTGAIHDRILQQARVAAAISTPILIFGEPGSGRRTVARTIHQLGSFVESPIVFIDAEALPPELLERQILALFQAQSSGNGHDPSEVLELQRAGSRLIATCVIGDITQLPRDIQAKLVSLLNRENAPRFLAITAMEPDLALKNELIRSDLYYSLTPLVLRIPPLRERRSEIPILAQFFLERANRRGGQQKTGFTHDAEHILTAYDWPGNLRELERVINHAREQSNEVMVSAADLPPSIQKNRGAAYNPPSILPALKPLDELLTEIERRLIEQAYQKARGNKSKAAEHLGISRPRLYRRMKELNLLEDNDLDEDQG